MWFSNGTMARLLYIYIAKYGGWGDGGHLANPRLPLDLPLRCLGQKNLRPLQACVITACFECGHKPYDSRSFSNECHSLSAFNCNI